MRRSTKISSFPDFHINRSSLPLTEVLEPRCYRSAADPERADDNSPAAAEFIPPAINAVAQRVIATDERFESSKHAAKTAEDEVQLSADPPDKADPPDQHQLANFAFASDPIRYNQSPPLGRSSAADNVLERSQFWGKESPSQINTTGTGFAIPIASASSTLIFSTTAISTVLGNFNQIAHSEGPAIAANLSASTAELGASTMFARDILAPAVRTPLVIGPLVFQFASVNAASFSDGLARFIDQCAEESEAPADEKPSVSHIRAWAATLGVVAVDFCICRAVIQRRQKLRNRGTARVASSSRRAELQSSRRNGLLSHCDGP